MKSCSALLCLLGRLGNHTKGVFERQRVDDQAISIFCIDPAPQIDQSRFDVAREQVTHGTHDPGFQRVDVRQFGTFSIDQLVRAVPEVEKISWHARFLRRAGALPSLSRRVA